MSELQSIAKLKRIKNDLENQKHKKQKELFDIDTQLIAINRVIDQMTNRGGVPVPIIEIPQKYTLDMLQEKKVIYVLHILKEANVKEISDFMATLEPREFISNIYRRVQQVINRMKKENKVLSSGDYASKYKLNI